MAVDAPTDLAGQQVVGTRIQTPWMPGTWEVTQGWGATDYGGEPEGHGALHWHAGVDIGCSSGTVLTLPAGLSGTARLLDNPGGYGTALVLLLDSGQGVVLGHLRQRYVGDGQVIRPGELLAATDSTGNSTGPHLHFEVRPLDPKTALGIARYGTDVDPSALLLSGTPGAAGAQLLAAQGPQNPYNPLDPRAAIWDAEQGFAAIADKFIASGQVALGSGMLLAGLLVTGYGARGRSAGDLQRDVVRTWRRRPAPKPAPRREPAPMGAERTRLRPSLQRRLPRATRPAP